MSNRLRTGQYDSQSLYILDNDKLIPALLHLDSSKDLIAHIDGFYVLAPGWVSCNSCPSVPSSQTVSLSRFIPSAKELISFGRIDEPRYLLNVSQGWAHPEPWGIWSDGGQAQLILGLPKEKVKMLILTARAFVKT
jgi:hypothetical protein